MPLFPQDKLFLIAGPCVLESDDLNRRVADHLAKVAHIIPGGVIFKASFDKANRSNPGAARGPGIDEGLETLAKVGRSSGLPLLTDVHLPEQCGPAADVVDVLQIPAFLCRQTDLLMAAGATNKAVNVKKGQWMHPEGMKGAVDKVRAARSGSAERRKRVALGAPAGHPERRERPWADAVKATQEIAVTERGSFYGYGDLVVDMRGFARMKAACNAPVIFDATHSVQQPGKGADGSSGGAREFIPPLVFAALGAGADGLFLETHPNPDEAPSDGPNMLPLKDLEALLRKAVDIWDRARR
ncbi:MAG TPA: 3-deoxy-8-phosphooctulonate synthase [Gemmatimonadaceae bacterium]|nr:3-deoxy-8-phosphooctulonate synthase [Gemmatimonadaceae bacterium]